MWYRSKKYTNRDLGGIMVDRLGAGVAILFAILLLMFWNQFTSSIPTSVSSTTNFMTIIMISIIGLLAYAKLDKNRGF